jgi:hypothetical protein
VLAHQAYWGFRFLAENKETLWQELLSATLTTQIQEVGRTCSLAGAMDEVGCGAVGLMTELEKENVALQVLAGKNHRRYPGSDRPSSLDRRMIFLGVAVAAGIWEIEFSTALRKLAQAGLGPHYMSDEVHDVDRLREYMRRNSIVFAEPVENYFYRAVDGEWQLVRGLPCKVPTNFRGGFIIHGYGQNGSQSTFSRTLPEELRESAETSSSA